MRRLLYRFADELKLPVYVLVDNDPWGYYIYSVVKQGSINLAYESRRMAVPTARFIGMSSFDAAKFDLPRTVTIQLQDQNDSLPVINGGQTWTVDAASAGGTAVGEISTRSSPF